MAITPLYVNNLVAKTTLSDDDLVIIGEGNNAKKMTIAQLKDQLGINALNTNISSLQNSTDKMGVYDAWANGQTTLNVVFKVPQNGGQYRPAFLIMGNVGGTPFMLICTVSNLTENLVAATCVDITGDVSSKMTVNVNANLGDLSQLRIQIVTPANMGSRIQVLVPAGQITGQW